MQHSYEEAGLYHTMLLILCVCDNMYVYIGKLLCHYKHLQAMSIYANAYGSSDNVHVYELFLKR